MLSILSWLSLVSLLAFVSIPDREKVTWFLQERLQRLWWNWRDIEKRWQVRSYVKQRQYPSIMDLNGFQWQLCYTVMHLYEYKSAWAQNGCSHSCLKSVKAWPCLRLGICNQIQPWGWNLCRRVILLRLGGTIQWQVVFFGKLHWTSIIWIVELESWCARICWTINYQHLLTNSIVMSSSKMLEVWEHYYEVGMKLVSASALLALCSIAKGWTR